MDAGSLADIEAVRQLKARYFRLMDTKRWDEWRDVFTDDLLVWVPDDSGVEDPTVGRDAFVEGTRAFIEAVTTIHHGHMSEVRVDGDTATGITAMEDHLWWPPGGPMAHMWGTGWYEETYRRGDDGEWRIATMRLRRIRIEVDGDVVFPRGSRP